MHIFFVSIYVVLSLLFTGCDRAPTSGEVAASYSGRLNGASESLILNGDGTFSQTVSLPSGETVAGSGNWSLTHKAVSLDGYMLYYAEEQGGALMTPKRVVMTYVWGGGTLFNEFGSGGYSLMSR